MSEIYQANLKDHYRFLLSTVIRLQGTSFVKELKTELARGTEKVKGMPMTFPPTLAMLGTLVS